MRWDGQRVDNDGQQPVLPGIGELVRSVRTPEFAGLVFHEVQARSVLNRVPGGSTMPFSWTVNPYRGCSHGCTYCLDGSTPILMADGRTRPIAKLAVGDRIYGTRCAGRYRRYVQTEVLAQWSTERPAYQITLADGRVLIASADHRFLTERGWKHVTGQTSGAGRRPHLTTGNKLMGTGGFSAPPLDNSDYRRGYLIGLLRGLKGATFRDRVARFHASVVEPDVALRASTYLTGFGLSVDPTLADEPLLAWPDTATPGRDKGFLAGVFDSRGSHSSRVLRIRNADHQVLRAVLSALQRLEFNCTAEDAGSNARTSTRVVRLNGGLAEHLRFFHTVDPATVRKLSIDGMAVKSGVMLDVVSVEPTGDIRQLYDITTGTGDFVANGVISHNCFARQSHTYLEMDSGHDFDTQVVVKVNAVPVLTKQLAAKKWQREHVAMGTNTDPYQRAEGRYQLMPGIINALAQSGTPLSILTKGTVLSRDIPLLAQVSRDVSVGIGVSLALLDREIQRSLEPGTPSPQARLELVRRVREAGLPCGVFVAPVLPGLTDTTEHLDRLFAAIAETGATGVTVLPLHLRPGAREWFSGWLHREHPDLVPMYRSIYGTGSYATRRYRSHLAERVGPLLRRHNLDVGRVRRTDDTAEPTWPTGSLPGNAPTAPQLHQEQLTLL